MSDSKEMKDEAKINGDPASTGDNPTDSSTEEKPSTSRRQFFTGMATALGAGVVLHQAQQLTAAEKSAAEVRSRIVSRIQEELKKSQSEMLFGYDKPDTPTPYGRYIKAGAE